jgi:hypothetical protein
MITNPSQWSHCPESAFQTVLNWINSGESLQKYSPKHPAAAIMDPVPDPAPDRDPDPGPVRQRIKLDIEINLIVKVLRSDES